ncbi:hypothetical protein AB0M58_13185 [Streptomyces bobili]|uniref:hypothetical protein n=1 Tax=Streptomyces bobili TaxID=67280 RepID=UPI00341F8C07
MSQTITAPAGHCIETDHYGIKYLFTGGDFIGRLTRGRTPDTVAAFSVRDNHLPQDYADDQAAADALVTAFSRPVPHAAGEVHRETYRDIEFAITFKPGGCSDADDQGNRNYWADSYSVTYNGRGAPCPKGNLATVIKKVRGWTDTRHADNELLPKLLELVDARQSIEGMPGFDGAPKEGDTAYVWAMGRFRRGLVTKVTQSRATVSYTTASSQGRVFHKADKFDALATA